MQPLKPGVVGELYIGGSGLAHGYIGKPALTAESFVPNPFAKSQRLYRSGDLALIEEDGEIRFKGRKDHQVNLNGHRVELGEIEGTMLSHKHIRQAAVLVIDDRITANRLVAVVEPADGALISKEEVVSYLQKFLPPYMVPRQIVFINKLPLTVTGKLDRLYLSRWLKSESSSNSNTDKIRVLAQDIRDLADTSSPSNDCSDSDQVSSPFFAVVSEKKEYSLIPASLTPPPGWTRIGESMERKSCLAFIERQMRLVESSQE